MSGGGPGASNAPGPRFQRACALWLSQHGWPLAASFRQGADMIAGPVAVEATIDGWDMIWAKLAQSVRQAAKAGVPYAVVWKRGNMKGPGRSAIVMQADQFWHLIRTMEEWKKAADAAESDLRRWMDRERERVS